MKIFSFYRLNIKEHQPCPYIFFLFLPRGSYFSNLNGGVPFRCARSMSQIRVAFETFLIREWVYNEIHIKKL